MKTKLYTIKEASQYLGVTPMTLRRWEHNGYLIAQRIGKRRDRRYTEEQLQFIRLTYYRYKQPPIGKATLNSLTPTGSIIHAQHEQALIEKKDTSTPPRRTTIPLGRPYIVND